MRMPARNRFVLMLFISQCVWLAACTNSTFVHKRLYNHMDDHIVADVNRIVGLNDAQKKGISKTAQQFQLWHRTTQLPLYADIMQTVSIALESETNIKTEEIALWIDEVTHHINTAQNCLPLTNLEPVMLTLSQNQLSELIQNVNEKHSLAKQKRSKFSVAELNEKRFLGIKKWFSRAGLTLSTSQKNAIKHQLNSIENPPATYHLLFDQWMVDFLAELQQSAQTRQFDTLWRQVNRLWTLRQDNYPELHSANQNKLIQAVAEFVESMSVEQRNIASRWLANLSRSVRSISKDVKPMHNSHVMAHDCYALSL